MSNPYVWILAISKSRRKQSNAFDRSVNSAPKLLPKSGDSLHFSIIGRRVVKTLNPFLNPHWYRDKLDSKQVSNCLYKSLSYILEMLERILTVL